MDKLAYREVAVPEVYRLETARGMPVLLAPQPRRLDCHLQLHLLTGAADEATAVEGICHAWEHLLFFGSSRRRGEALMNQVRLLGGELFAETSDDSIIVTLSAPEGRLRELVALLLDTVRFPGWQGRDFRDERRVIEAEIIERARPSDQVKAAFRRLLWRGMPHSRSVLGSPASLASISPRTLRSLQRYLIAPSRCLLVALGPFAGRELIEALDAHPDFAWGKTSPAIVPRPTPPPLSSPRRVEVTEVTGAPPSAAMIAMGWRTPPFGHADLPALRVALLGALLYARGRGLSAIQPSIMVHKDVGASGFSTFAPLDYASDVAEIMQSAPSEMLAELDDDELEMLCEQAYELGLAPLDAGDKVAKMIGYSEATTGDPRRGFAELAALRTVGFADLSRVIHRYFQPTRCNGAFLVARGQGASLRRHLEGLSAKSFPPILRPSSGRASHSETRTLANGVRLLNIDTPRIAAEIVLPGGPWRVALEGLGMPVPQSRSAQGDRLRLISSDGGRLLGALEQLWGAARAATPRDAPPLAPDPWVRVEARVLDLVTSSAAADGAPPAPVVACAGPVDVARLEALNLTSALSPWRGKPRPCRGKPRPCRGRPRPCRRSWDVEVFSGEEGPLAALAIGFRLPAIASRDHAAALVLCQVLGGQAGRLFRAVREERGLVYDIDCQYRSSPWAGCGLIMANMVPAHVDAVLDVVRETVEGLVKDGVEDLERRAAATYSRGHVLLEAERPAEAAAWLAWHAACGVRRPDPTRYGRRLAQVSVADLRRVCERWFAVAPSAVIIARG